jgi:hypothetical protein
MYAMQRKHNTTFAGTFFNVLIKKIPGIPKFLKKNKELSKAKLVTTSETFIGEVVRQGLNPEDYKDKIEELRSDGNRFIIRKPVYSREDELKEIEYRIWHSMQDKIKSSYFKKNRGDLCSRMCSFSTLCDNYLPEWREELFMKKAWRHSELNGANSNKGI